METVLSSSSSSSSSAIENLSHTNVSTLSAPTFVRSLSSPSSAISSSELDDRASHRSLSLSSPSPGAGTNRSSSSERFLYLESPAGNSEEVDSERRRHSIASSSSCGTDQDYNNVTRLTSSSSSPPPPPPPPPPLHYPLLQQHQSQPVQNGGHYHRGIPHKEKRSSNWEERESSVAIRGDCVSMDQDGRESALECLQSAGMKEKRVKAMKLRHFATTSSPCITSSPSPSTTTSQTVSTPITSPLIVSVSLSSLPSTSNFSSPHSSSASSPLFSPTTTAYGHAPNSLVGKQRRRTALSNFATKKRALNRSPSSRETTHSSSPSVEIQESSIKSTRSIGTMTTLITGNIRTKPGRENCKEKNKVGRSTTLENGDGVEVMTTTSVESKSQSKQHPPMLLPMQKLDVAGGPGRPTEEDDKISLASSSPTGITTCGSSGTSSSTTTGMRAPQRRGGRRKYSRSWHNNNNNDDVTTHGDGIFNTNTNFSFQSLFSYYPPTLTVRDGELVPEKSLSIENLERSDLPPSHPIFNWQLGQPVRPRWLPTPRGKRPRKMS